MTHKKLDEAAKRAERKMRVLLQHKTMELLLYDIVGTQGIPEAKNILAFWLERLDEY